MARRMRLSAHHWQTNGGLAIEQYLASGAVALLDAAWLCAEAASGSEQPLRHRQEMPADAFVSLEDIKAASGSAPFLPIIVVSSPWLHPCHPDPLGQQLQVLASALRQFIAHGVDRWGVCWSFCSIMQADANGKFDCSADETLHQEGLLGLGALLAHRAVTVFMLTAAPDGYPLRYNLPKSFPGWSKYQARGWSWAESAIASLTKRSELVLVSKQGLKPWTSHVLYSSPPCLPHPSVLNSPTFDPLCGKDLGKLTDSKLNCLAGRHGLLQEW